MKLAPVVQRIEHVASDHEMGVQIPPGAQIFERSVSQNDVHIRSISINLIKNILYLKEKPKFF